MMRKLSPLYFVLDLYNGEFRWITKKTFENIMEIEGKLILGDENLLLWKYGDQDQMLVGAFYGDVAHFYVE